MLNAALLNNLTNMFSEMTEAGAILRNVKSTAYTKWRDDSEFFFTLKFTWETVDSSKDYLQFNTTTCFFDNIDYFNYSLIQYIGSFNEEFNVALMSYPSGIVLDDEDFLGDDEYADMQRLKKHINNFRKTNLGWR